MDGLAMTTTRRTPDGSAPHSRPRAKKRRGIFVRALIWLFCFGLLCAVAAGIAATAVYRQLSLDLPKITSLSDYRPPTVTVVYSDDGTNIAEFFKERRIVLPLAEMPPQLIDAFVAAEDSRFYQHRGIDVVSIVRAFFKNLEAGTIVQGGSTITQQVTKSFLLTPERSYTRKLKEAILAYRIERAFTKEEILYLYLNQIYLGHGAYGVQAAAENYFGKSVQRLTLAECALLAGLPQAPSKYSPFRNAERAKQRQIYVLNRMVAEGYVTEAEANAAIRDELDIKPRRNLYIEQVPFYTEHVRRYLEARYGEDALYNQGLQVYTAVNLPIQKMAREAIDVGLRELDKRQGYRGVLNHLAGQEIETLSKAIQEELAETPLAPGRMTRGVVVAVDDKEKTLTVRMGGALGEIALADMTWARKPDPEIAYYSDKVKRPGDVLRVGDVILVKVKAAAAADGGKWPLALEQDPAAQAALLCIEAGTGMVKAMVGGWDFRESQFNRAVQSRRQPGSAFKPIIYAAALDKQFEDSDKVYTPATVIVDSAIVYNDTERDFVWKPQNYRETFYGPTLLREALAKSRNLVTIKILQDIGVDYVIDYARKLGIASELSRDLSIALGSSGVSLLELTQAYSVFANQGDLIEPVFVVKVVDRDGNVLEAAEPKRTRVIDAGTAFIMTSLMESVVNEGTGQRVKALGRPTAGKTGTTNDLYDAWFMGYIPQYITGTWVGFDEEAPLGKGETGARAASPIWLHFMQQLTTDLPVKTFQVPENIEFAKIDADTGLLPIPESKKTILECFKEGTVPTQTTKRPGEVTETAEFFKKDL